MTDSTTVTRREPPPSKNRAPRSKRVRAKSPASRSAISANLSAYPCQKLTGARWPLRARTPRAAPRPLRTRAAAVPEAFPAFDALGSPRSGHGARIRERRGIAQQGRPAFRSRAIKSARAQGPHTDRQPVVAPVGRASRPHHHRHAAEARQFAFSLLLRARAGRAAAQAQSETSASR
jgi:hypothetical protein